MKLNVLDLLKSLVIFRNLDLKNMLNHSLLGNDKLKLI